MTSPLIYPKDLQTGQVDYVTFTHHEYRTNRKVTGSDVSGSGSHAHGAGPAANGRTIVLYMPTSTPAIGTANDWGDVNFEGNLGAVMGNIGAGLTNRVMSLEGGDYDSVKRFTKGTIDAAKNQVAAASSMAGGAAQQFGVELVSGIVPASASQLLALSRGAIFNPNVELLYSGPKVRGFNMSFTFVPKSQSEAEIVNSIIKEFKVWSAPADIGNGMYKVPDVWQVTYMKGSDPNPNMNAFKRAALTNVAVQNNPGLDMHMTFPNGMPVLTTLSLNFTEVDVIIREDHDRAPTNVGY